MTCSESNIRRGCPGNQLMRRCQDHDKCKIRLSSKFAVNSRVSPLDMSHFATSSCLVLLVTGCVAFVHLASQEGSFVGWGRSGAVRVVATAAAVAPATGPRVVPQSLDSSLVDLIKQLPKAELHIHIEGTLEADMMMQFAARNNVSLPYASVEEARAARWAICEGAWLQA